MKYGLAAVFLFTLQTILILSTNFTVWPELSLFPYLVHHGLIPYRDFFDHHGFLLYYLLAPFVADGSAFDVLHAIYFLLQSVNLLLVLFILRKLSSFLGFVIGGLLFVFVSFFVAENNFWYEIVLTTFYLALLFLVLLPTSRRRDILIALGIVAASCIKPTASIILFPILLYTKRVTILFYCIIAWLSIGSAIWVSGGFSAFIEGAVFYNRFLQTAYTPYHVADKKFILSSAFLSLFALLILFLSRKLFVYRVLPLFLFSSLVFVGMKYGREHLLPVCSIFSLLLGTTIAVSAKKKYYLFLAAVTVYVLLLGRKVFLHRQYLVTHRVPWQEQVVTPELLSYLSRLRNNGERIFILSNHAELYLFLTILPPTYFPLKFPFIEQYFPHYEGQIIADMEKQNVSVIVTQVPFEKLHGNLPTLQAFIQERFLPIYRERNVLVYAKLTKGGMLK